MTRMQYALDANGSWANAKLAEYKKHSQFFCGCAERHPVKLVKPSGVLGKRPFSDYFAHISRSEQDAVDGRAVHSCGCSESQDHFNAKHKLREMVGQYSFTTFRCITCHKRRVTYSRGCEVIVEKASKDRKWRYDCLLRRGGKDVAALEVLHSHKVTREKASSVRDGGLEIAEFRAEDILHALTDSPTKTVHLDNLLVQLGKCQSCAAKEDLKWMRTCWRHEQRELQFQELYLLDYYRDVEYKQLLEARETARRQLEALERCTCLVEKGLMWRRDCFLEELRELIQQETDVVADYINLDARNSKMLARKKQLSETFLSYFKRI
jgi:hypothetical protein